MSNNYRNIWKGNSHMFRLLEYDNIYKNNGGTNLNTNYVHFVTVEIVMEAGPKTTFSVDKADVLST
jgi:hypothetical protein